MKKSIFQEKNLVSPEEVFNILGEREFQGEWSNLPMRVLGAHKNTFKISDDKYRRNKYMADSVFQKLGKFLKDPKVSIYAPKKSLDEQDDCTDIVEWKNPCFRISKDNFFLIEQLSEDGYGGVDISRRFFWVEMPKEENPLLSKGSGHPTVHDVGYMKLILPMVAMLIEGDITDRELEKAYADYLADKGVVAPKKSWINANLEPELSKLKAARNV